jgi:hypothetical protein
MPDHMTRGAGAVKINARIRSQRSIRPEQAIHL